MLQLLSLLLFLLPVLTKHRNATLLNGKINGNYYFVIVKLI